MHRIFCVSELLHEIFSYSSSHTNTVAARVCREWFTHSIPFIWDTVWFNDVLKLLSSIGDDGFQQPLLPDSWRRFLLYSENVRQLQCLETHGTALRQALLWRPCGDLFSSKLTVLQWDGPPENLEYLPPLLTSTLQILHIDVDAIINPNALDVLHRTIPVRSLSLRAFELSFPPVKHHNHAHAISQSLARLFSFLLELVDISIPIHCMTDELFTTLSLLPRLQSLLLHSSSSLDMEKTYADRLPQQKSTDEEEAGKCLFFHSLEELEVSYSCEQRNHERFTMAQILRHGTQFLKMVELHYSPRQESFNQLATLMALVPTICPNLRHLTLYGAAEGLPWQAIQPLLKCSALVELISCGTIDMELEDIVTVATSRTSWKVIRLPSKKPLSYHALVAFAQNCPDLYQLCLTLDNKLQFPDPKTFATDIKFSSLAYLDVGRSPLASGISEVATFLSSIFQTPPRISAFGNPYMSSWEAVSFIIKTQLEMRTLKQENALLKAQSSVPGT